MPRNCAEITFKGKSREIKMNKFWKTALLCVTLLTILPVTLPGIVHADNDAMDYVAVPLGSKVAFVYYQHIAANKSFANGEKVSDDANLQQNLAIFRGVYFTELGPFKIDPQIIWPIADATLDGAAFGNQEISATGLADPIVTATIWFVDDPKSKTWFGFTPFIYVPIGDYDEDRAFNIGSNRWSFKPEFGFAKGFDKWHVDLTAALQIYLDNDEYLRNSTLEQDPELTIEAHLTYKWTDTFNMTLSWFHHREGETSVNGVDNGDDLDNHRLGLALTWWLSPQLQFMVKYYRDVEVESGFEQNLVGMRLLHLF